MPLQVFIPLPFPDFHRSSENCVVMHLFLLFRCSRSFPALLCIDTHGISVDFRQFSYISPHCIIASHCIFALHCITLHTIALNRLHIAFSPCIFLHIPAVHCTALHFPAYYSILLHSLAYGRIWFPRIFPGIYIAFHCLALMHFNRFQSLAVSSVEANYHHFSEERTRSAINSYPTSPLLCHLYLRGTYIHTYLT